MGGIRTVAPLGEWTDWVFSEELKEYEKYGYKFETIKGYTFDKKNIFKAYIQVLYEIKKNTPKSDPMYLISKLLMNSLYGRFGMTANLPKHSIFNNKDLLKDLKNKDNEILDIIELGDDVTLVSYNENIVNDSFDDDQANINVAIAAAIPAFGRIVMSKYLGDNDLKIWATDTDSLITDVELPTSNELGDLKLEAKYDEACFIAPKVYGGILSDGSSFTKVKGYKNYLEYLELKKLLNENSSLTLKHDKWFKNFEQGNISIQETVYSLKVTDNKRKVIHEKGNFVNTKPYIIDNCKTIKKDSQINNNR